MTRICLIEDEFIFAVIRDGVLCGTMDFGYFHKHRLRIPDKVYGAKDRHELEAKFLLPGIGTHIENNESLYTIKDDDDGDRS